VTRHWNSRASSYFNNIKKDFLRPEIRRRWEKVLVDFIGSGENLMILDAGCGPAPITRILTDLGHQVIGVDISVPMLAKAKELMAEDFGEVSFMISDVSNMPFSDATIDLVISRHLIWTLPEPQKAVREWYRILKPGGRLAIIDGNWYLNYPRPTLRKYLVHLSHMFYKIRSGFDDSQKLAIHYIKELPTTYLHRPDWDLGLLAGIGFSDLKASTDLAAKIWVNPWERMLHDLSYGMFLVEATKPCNNSGKTESEVSLLINGAGHNRKTDKT